MITTKRIKLLEGNTKDVQNSSKSLKLPQANGNYEKAVRKSATSKYLQRMRHILMSQLNGKKQKTKTKYEPSLYALSVIRLPTGNNNLAAEKDGNHCQERKLLTMHGRFCSKSSLLRLYTNQKVGGLELMNIKACK